MSTLKPLLAHKDLWIDPDSKRIHARIWIGHIRKSKSTGIQVSEITRDEKTGKYIIPEPDLKKALSILRKEILPEITKTTRKLPTALFMDEWPKWIELRKKTWSKGTLADVKSRQARLLTFMGDRDVREVDEHLWEEFIGYMADNYPGYLMVGYRRYLSMFCHYLFRKGLILRTPRFRNPDPDTKAGRVFSEEEIEALLNHAGDPLWLQIQMGNLMGMRHAEIMQCSKSWVDLKNGIIHLPIHFTKTRKERVVPIHPLVRHKLKEQMNLYPSSPWVFPNPRDSREPQERSGNRSAWATCKKRAGIHGRFHDLRHTCATRFAREKVAPQIACRILGMSLEVYDRIYCKPTMEDLKAVFNGK